jgi:O-antigen/teichoic acid export membrane protein
VLGESLPLWVASAGRFALQWTGILVLGAWGSSADVGIFGVATRLALVSNLILTAVNTATAPRFAALHRRGDREGLERLARRSVALLAVATAPILVAMLAAPGRLMALFGAEFAPHGSVLVILALGQSVNLATGSVGQILVMTGHSRAVRQTVLGAAAANLLLSLALVPGLGALGAAAASGVALAIQNVAAALLVWKHLGIAVVPLPLRTSRWPVSPGAFLSRPGILAPGLRPRPAARRGRDRTVPPAETRRLAGSWRSRCRK